MKKRKTKIVYGRFGLEDYGLNRPLSRRYNPHPNWSRWRAAQKRFRNTEIGSWFRTKLSKREKWVLLHAEGGGDLVRLYGVEIYRGVS